MKTSRLSAIQLRSLCIIFISGRLNITRDAAKLHLSRNTLRRHIDLLQQMPIAEHGKTMDIASCISWLQQPAPLRRALISFRQVLSKLTATATIKGTVKELWQAYLLLQPDGYRYSQFAFHYSAWRKLSPGVHNRLLNNIVVSESDHSVLATWRRSNDRRKWEKAVLLLELKQGQTLSVIAEKTERSPETLRTWLKCYANQGLEGLLPSQRRTKANMSENIAIKKQNLIRLIHEPPQLHGFNRTSWRLKDLAVAYQRLYGTSVSITMISVYIRQEGYVFRKARKVLTSPDPDFREKLAHIQSVLSGLGPREKFFSIDEYGPFSLRMKGGTALVKQGEFKTYPQHQKSKGFLICTAALELSTNQVTHFYSRKKDTEEMIKLIDLLCLRYYDQEKIYLSWDAAIWHASKKLLAHLSLLNADDYRAAHQSPLVELAPLPASAQFLNVIESVFSGLARSVIHHSDYASVGHCQAAIDRYFKERNEHFALHPKKAGKKIWGKERTVAEFRDNHNCKDPAWR